MSEHPLIIDTNPPAAVVVGSGNEYGLIDLNIAGDAIDAAQRVSFAIENEASDTPEVRDLKNQLRALADVTTQLAGQLYQLGHAVEAGRIAVVRREF